MFAICIVVILAIFICLIWKYRERVRIRNGIILSILFLFLSRIKDTPDITNYIYTYLRENYTFKDVGFQTLCNFFKRMGLDYYQFQTIYFLIIICIIAYALLRICDNRTIIYLLYVIFPFLYNAIQIRNFFVLAMLTLAYSLVSSTSKRGKIISWVVCIIIASTQHVLALGFLPFALVLGNKKISKNILIVMSAITLVFLVIPNSGILSVITSIISSLADEHRTLKYTVRSTHLGQYAMIARSVIMIAIVFFGRKKIEIMKGQNDNEIKLEPIIIAEDLMLYSSVFWPLYVLNGNFTRLMQDESLILYYVISVYYSTYKQTHTSMKKYSIPISSTMILSFALIVYNGISLWILNNETVVQPLLQSGK